MYMTVNIPNDHNMFLLFILCLQVFEISYINLFPQALIEKFCLLKTKLLFA